MAKTKQKPVSAAQRREREKQQRQQRLSSSQNNRSQTRNKGKKQSQSNLRQWLLIGGVLAIIAIIIGVFVIFSNQQSGSPSGPAKAISQVFNAVTNVDPNVLIAVGTGGVQNPLQTLTTEQQNLLSTYDVAPYTTQSGSIPFIDIANQYIISGASYSPQDLQSLQWKDIANNLSDPTSTVGKDILGTANYMTAGICKTTHQQPGSVCNTDVIQKIEQSLGKSSVVPGGAQIAVAGYFEAVTRREEI